MKRFKGLSVVTGIIVHLHSKKYEKMLSEIFIVIIIIYFIFSLYFV